MRAASIIMVAVLAVLIAGCAPAEEQATGAVTQESSPTTAAVEQDAEEPATREYEVRMTSEGFFPATFHAAEGETLALTFLLDEPHFISIDGLGVAENIQAGTIEVAAEEAGEYSLLCLDCDDAQEALLVFS